MATVTRTSTVLTTTTQIVSSATQVKCIPANQFVGGTAPAACARRRRDIESPGLLDIIQPDVPLEWVFHMKEEITIIYIQIN